MTKPKRVTHHAGDDQKQGQHHRRQHRHHRKNPCPHAPKQIAAADIVGTFELHEGPKRHQYWQLGLRWPEVTVDTDGFPLRAKSYTLRLQYSADGVNWFDAQRLVVPAKDEDDPNTVDHHKFKHVHAKLAYRARVRANSEICSGEWSNWKNLNSATEGPPAPSDVRIRRASHGIRVGFSMDPDVADDNLFTEAISHFLAQLWTNSSFGPTGTFTATAADDKFTKVAHGFVAGQPITFRNTPGSITLPAPIKAHKVYFVANITTDTFKVTYEEDGTTVNLTSNGSGTWSYGLVRVHRHLHKHTHVFEIGADDFDEDTYFYARVASVSGDGTLSAFIPATGGVGNDNPLATPDGRRPAWHRHVFTATINDTVTDGLYRVPNRVDDDYIVRRGAMFFDDAAGGGAPTYFDFQINGGAGGFVFNEDTSKQPQVASGAKGGNSKQVVNRILERGDTIRVKAYVTGSPPGFGTVHLICDRIGEGSTTDSAGG